jgi:hypothetical protein
MSKINLLCVRSIWKVERQNLEVKTMSLRSAVNTTNASALEDSIRQRGPPEA